MKTRLKQIIDIKCGGRQATFSRQTGIIPQRVTKLLNGATFGIQAVSSILRAYPDIDARWLILGEGEMLTPSGKAEMLRTTLAIFDCERYVKYMDDDEKMYYTRCIMDHVAPDFPPERLAELQYAWRKDQEVTLSVHSNALTKSTKRHADSGKPGNN